MEHSTQHSPAPSNASAAQSNGRDLAIVLVAVLLTTFVLSLAISTLQPAGVGPSSLSAVSLAKLNTAQLLMRPRTADVCREILRRSDVDSDVLRASLIRLARRLHQTQVDTLTLLAEGLQDDTGDAEFDNLCCLPNGLPESEQSKFRERLLELTVSGNFAATRRFAFASLISMDGNAETAFRTAASEQLFRDLLLSLPHVRSLSLQEQLYDRIRPLLHSDADERAIDNRDQTDEDLRKLAIAVSVRLAGREAEKATDFMALIRREQCRPAAVLAMAALPSDTCPEDELRFLAAAVIACIAEVPLENRSREDVSSVVQFGHALGNRLPVTKRNRFLKRLAELTGNDSDSR